jgi:hypothetical protein
MSEWEENVYRLERHIYKLDNPRMFSRMQAWKRRLSHIRSHPDCSCLEDLGHYIRPEQPVKTIDLSVLYPAKRRAA